MSPAATGLEVRLARADGRVRVSLALPAPALDARRLVGRAVEEAAVLVPLVYAVCAATQEAAMRLACGLPTAPDLPARVARDALRDHLVHLFVTLPEALGRASDHVAVRDGVRGYLAGDVFAELGDGLFAPGAEPASLADLVAWARPQRGAPAAALWRLLHGWDAAWGRASLPLMPDALDPDRIDWDDAALDGGAVEPGAASAHAAHPLLVDIATRLGAGPVWRVAARLIEASALAANRGAEPARLARRLAPGIGAALSSRGVMLVRVAHDGGRIAAFARLAPTDFVLNARGLLARSLETLPSEPDAPLVEIASTLVAVADPCVASAVRLAPPPAAYGRDAPARREEALHA